MAFPIVNSKEKIFNDTFNNNVCLSGYCLLATSFFNSMTLIINTVLKNMEKEINENQEERKKRDVILQLLNIHIMETDIIRKIKIFNNIGK